MTLRLTGAVRCTFLPGLLQFEKPVRVEHYGERVVVSSIPTGGGGGSPHHNMMAAHAGIFGGQSFQSSSSSSSSGWGNGGGANYGGTGPSVSQSNRGVEIGTGGAARITLDGVVYIRRNTNVGSVFVPEAIPHDGTGLLQLGQGLAPPPPPPPQQAPGTGNECTDRYDLSAAWLLSDLEVNGSSHLTICNGASLDETLSASVGGASCLVFAGEQVFRRLSLEVSGASRVCGSGGNVASAATLTVNASGSSRVQDVAATDDYDIDASGASNVEYSSGARGRVQSSGAAVITRR